MVPVINLPFGIITIPPPRELHCLIALLIDSVLTKDSLDLAPKSRMLNVWEYVPFNANKTKTKENTILCI
jgi:hypothetical protein